MPKSSSALPPDIKILSCNNFSEGLNTLDDPIVLQNGESPLMLNVNVNQQGAIVCRYGYELVSSIAGVTGPMRGALQYYRTYGTNSGDYLLLFHSNGHAYVVTNSNFTPTDLGSYGTDDGMVRGAVFNNLAIFGNGLAANSVQKYDGSAMGNLGGSPPDANIFSVFAKRLFATGVATAPSTVYYTEVDDPEDWSGGSITVDVGDGSVCTGFAKNANFLQTFKQENLYGINFQYDNTFNISAPLLQPIVNGLSGAIAPGSIVAIYGFTFYLSRYGIEFYGPSGALQNLNVPLSLKIDPTIQKINRTYINNVNSTFADQQYLMTAPINNSVTNNTVFVFNETIRKRFGVNSWSLYDDIPALQFVTFRDSKKNDQLYFVSTTEPNLYRFNKTFSDAGFGYSRIWRSKTFQFGSRTRWWWLDIDGFMTQGTTIFVDINVDGVQRTFEIDSNNFVTPTTGGGYIGSLGIGSEYIGGGFLADSTTPMYRFSKRIEFPLPINFGYNMWFQVRNQGEGEGWSLTRYRIAYEAQPEEPSYARVYN